ncbi:hypothetical protein GOBAR_AA04079 [Gossypium barbadense]|uniref:Uncharacterized protein n=1 Tax=Gossypium barbadense TaxID=3634 RepID=A0A2P5YLK3_GOSBA|nr:hypothetical protein GOBAR_AA04079 [Gossypium barbadense]
MSENLELLNSDELSIEFEKEMLLNESLRDRGISTGCPGTMPLGSTVQFSNVCAARSGYVIYIHRDYILITSSSMGPFCLHKKLPISNKQSCNEKYSKD